MAETDPFGRAQDDDPLGEMGWTSSGTAPPGSGPSEVAVPEQPDAAVRRAARSEPYEPITPGVPGQRRMPRFRRRRRGMGCATAFVVLLVLAPIGALVGEVEDRVDDAGVPARPVEEDPAGGAPPSGGAETGDAEGGPPRGLSRASMLRRGNLAPALARLRQVTAASRVRLIRIDAQNVTVQTLTDDGRTRLARAPWEGEAEILATSPGGGGATFPWSRIDPSAPNRIVRAATRGRRASAFDYLVLIDAAGLRWSAYLKGGRHFTASPDGRDVTAVG